MKSTKKLLSLLMVIAMIFSLAVPAFADAEPAFLASWSDGTSLTNNGAADVLKNVELSAGAVSTDSTLSNQAVKTSSYGNLSATPWYGADYYAEGTQYAYVQFQLSTKGYENLSLSTVFGGNARVPLTYKLMYSLDGEAWTDVEGAIGAAASNQLENAISSIVAIPAAAADQETVYFRIAQTEGAHPKTEGGAGTNAGALYIYSISLAGTAKSAVTPPPAAPYEGKTVILHSNDVHGAVMGYANMAALKADYEAKGATVLVVDAGDFSQGTTYVSTSKGLEAVNLMNMVGYDFAAPGNHEFDYGYPQLVENLKSAQFDMLCCNILGADGNPVFKASAVVDVDGMKVGFIGVNTPESQTKANPALIQGLKWLAGDEMAAAVKAEAAKLKADGVDVIVALTHLGVDESSEPNTSYILKNTDVDFVIDGHSHTVMTSGTNGEAIQSTGTAFANVGVIVIDNATKAIENNELVIITADSAKDETVAAAAQKIIDDVTDEYGKVFAKSEVDLNGAKTVNADGVYGNRDGETNLGDLITDAMVWQVKQNLDGITVPEANIVAITNGGGIRAPIAKGDVTKNDVFTVLPFGNTVSVVYVTGAELLEALEASTFCTPKSVGGFPQVSGIEFYLDTTMEYDANDTTYPDSTYYGPKTINRVIIENINGKAFNANATYAVITNNFCAAGGDTYYAFASASAQFDTGVPLDVALMDYITEELKGVIGEKYAEPQGRINICTKGHDFENGKGTCVNCGLTPLTDISNSVFCDYIVAGYLGGVINGYPDCTFRPGNTVTRGQFITMLWRACGEPAAENAELSFADAGSIPADYKAAVAWGTEVGIVKGFGDNTFRANAQIARAQMATFCYRLMCLLEGEEAPDELKADYGFKDAASIAAPYVDAVNVCANLGILGGYDTDGDGEGDTFAPNGTATRGASAKIIVNMIILFAELEVPVE